MAKGDHKPRIEAFGFGSSTGARWPTCWSATRARTLVCFAVVLAACGGGGGGDAVPASSATPAAASGAGPSSSLPPVTQTPATAAPETAGSSSPGTGAAGNSGATSNSTGVGVAVAGCGTSDGGSSCSTSPGSGTAVDNVIRRENAKQGDSRWGLTAVSDTPTVEGYASHTSVNRGETIRFYVSSAASTYTMTIYRLGWYGGAGGRRMLSVMLQGARQPMPSPDAVTGLVEANWTESYRVTIPDSSDKTDWASGLYLAKLTPSSGTESYIMFWVRDDSSTATYVFQSAVTTAQAYNNNWGGKSLYGFNSTNGAARKVSFNRPYRRQALADTGAGQVLNYEINFVRFLEREGYDVTYVTSIDVHRDAGRLLQHRAFLVAGHDEYWTYEMRAGVQAARGRGVHLGFFSADQTYWQARLEASPRTGDANRTLVGYKDFSQGEDPFARDNDRSNDKYITARFRDMQRLFGVNDAVAQPENSLVGVMYHGDGINGDVVVSNASHWVFAGTGALNGTHLRGLLGYEADAVSNNGFSPTGLEIVGSSPDPFGTSNMTVYTDPSGAVVVATGTMQWSWGLDDYGGRGLVNGVVQQATRNVLSRFAKAP